MKHVIESGMKFWRLTILKLSETRDVRNRQLFLCRCDCGKILIIRRGSIASGETRSCGCYGIERRRESVKTHGLAAHPIYFVWKGMRARCKTSDPHHARVYLNRGITVCSEWDDFKTFYDDMIHTWKPGLWIERINNDLGYSKSNCRWATQIEQVRNKTNNRLLEFDGKRKPVSEWASVYGMKTMTLFSRLRYGWSVEDSLTKPLRTWPGPIHPE